MNPSQTTTMKEIFEESDWDPLIELLREEVQEYGGLYNLLDRQQNEIFNRDPDLVMEINIEVEAHMKQMDVLRQKRESMVREMAIRCQCDQEWTLKELLPGFPVFVRPLLEALIDEVNAMVRRTRQKARQNYLLLSRTMEIAHEALRRSEPSNYSKTYSRKGQVGVSGDLPTTYKALV
jgi:flagellar biosynthesis/type III secretory pathway chaperone